VVNKFYTPTAMAFFDFFKTKTLVKKNYRSEISNSILNHTVKRGDSLQKLAKKYYGDASEWERIYNANYGVITDPKKIYYGQQIIIP
jgi:nucleoid-associated protein YgaU